MKWTPGGDSGDVEDRRGEGGGGGFRLGPIHMGCGGFLILLVLSLIFKRNFFALLSGGDTPSPPAATDRPRPGTGTGTSPDDRGKQFVTFVLDDVQKTWDRLLPGTYRHAHLVLFTDRIDSACGLASTASGPFYCPRDAKVYLDLGFFDELRGRLGAGGDFAQAYVIAHEVGHHVQDLTGLLPKVHDAEERGDRRRASDLSVRTELQADCLAGVWGHSTNERGILEKGDVEEGLRAVAAVGDDRLQRMATGHVQPESFTHGTSEQRVRWFRRGLESGNPKGCDTFGAPSL